MRIAILGATSQIAKDLVQSFAAQGTHALVLYARRPEAVTQWLADVGLVGRYAVANFVAFNAYQHFDAILNFVGVGNPAQAAAMGASIFDVTLQYDELALSYVRQHPACRYIFLSSGAAYGASFDTPVDVNTKATVPINNLQPQDWYGVAKLHAECRHRALAPLPIVDIRVFNYFSHTQDMEARFLITDILRAIRDKTLLRTSTDYIVRDFIHPSDFYQLVNVMLTAPAINTMLDAYSKNPIDKPTLLTTLHEKFALQYALVAASVSVNATGSKPHYFSVNKQAAGFGYMPKFTSQEGLLDEFKKIHKECIPMLQSKL
jgi:nucleoside-diphosphate-sugar epimerase